MVNTTGVQGRAADTVSRPAAVSTAVQTLLRAPASVDPPTRTSRAANLATNLQSASTGGVKMQINVMTDTPSHLIYTYGQSAQT